MQIKNKEAMEKGSTIGVDYLAITVGDNVVRVVGEMFGVKEHRIEVPQIGGQPQVRNIACPYEMGKWEAEVEGTQDNDFPNCPLCDKGDPVKTQYLSFAVNRATEEAGILKKGKTVFGALQDYKEDSNWGDYSEYDVNIKAEGEKLLRKYTIVPVPKDMSKPLTEKELASLKEAQDKTDLKEMTVPRTADEIEKVAKGDDVPF